MTSSDRRTPVDRPWTPALVVAWTIVIGVASVAVLAAVACIEVALGGADARELTIALATLSVLAIVVACVGLQLRRSARARRSRRATFDV